MPATGTARRRQQIRTESSSRWQEGQSDGAVVTNVHKKLKLSNRLCPDVSTGDTRLYLGGWPQYIWAQILQFLPVKSS